jgi:hypothetical protein
MASIRQRSGTWQARVLREGYPAEVKSFTTRSEAQKWARRIEGAMDSEGYQSRVEADKMLLSDAFLRYVEEVSPAKRSYRDEVIRINALRRAKMAAYSMAKLSPAIVAGFRDGWSWSYPVSTDSLSFQQAAVGIAVSTPALVLTSRTPSVRTIRCP